MNPLLATAAILPLVLHAHAVSISIPNGSFESPDVTGIAPYFSHFPEDAPGVSGAWEYYATFNAVYEAGRYGELPAGLDGPQAATVSAAFGGGIFQDTAPYDGSGNPDLYWQEGTYTLTLALYMRSDNLPRTGDDPTASLGLRLFYREADQGAAHVLSQTSVTRGIDPLGTSAVTDFTVTHTVAPGAPEIGRPISIWLASTGGDNGDWGVDNVRLDFTAVPEPSVALLGGIGLLGLLLRRR